MISLIPKYFYVYLVNKKLLSHICSIVTKMRELAKRSLCHSADPVPITLDPSNALYRQWKPRS